MSSVKRKASEIEQEDFNTLKKQRTDYANSIVAESSSYLSKFASVKEIRLNDPKQQGIYDNLPFPLILSPAESDTFKSHDDFLDWLKVHRRWIDTDLLPKFGAVYLRGFPLPTAQTFSDFVEGFDWTFDTLKGGGGPRNNVVGNIKTSTESPPEVHIPLHHEVSYLKDTPARLVFYCDIEPASGGQTPVLLSNRLYKNMLESNSDFVKSIEEKGLRYIRKLEDSSRCNRDRQRPWQEVFDTNDKDIAIKRAHESGTETIEWNEKGTMIVTSKVFPGIVQSKKTNGLKTFFNAIALLHPASHGNLGKNAPWTVTYGDGSQIKDDDVLSIKESMKKDVIATNWKKGDVLLVDNNIALHSRNPFTPPRRILAAILRE